jgi:hypothetical protein
VVVVVVVVVVEVVVVVVGGATPEMRGTALSVISTSFSHFTRVGST